MKDRDPNRKHLPIRFGFPVGRTRRGARTMAVTTLAVFTALTVCARTRASELPAIEDLVRQWTELRRQASDEARDWREQEKRLRDEIRWLRLERDAWTEERTRIRDTGREEADRLEERRNHEAQLQAASERLGAVLVSIEERLRAWTPRIPPSHAGDWEEGLRRLPPQGTPAASGLLARRAQAVTALLSMIEEWQAGAHQAREILTLENGGEPREFEVVYLGLARGFARSADGAMAAVGEPFPDGWRWIERPDQAARIADALDAYATRDARLVALPIRLREIQP